MNVKIIRTDGSEKVHVLERATATSNIHKLISADLCDTVNLGDGMVMMVDDNGWETEMVKLPNGDIHLKPIRPRKPINAAATKLYHAVCIPGTTHQIVGDVAIVRDADFKSG